MFFISKKILLVTLVFSITFCIFICFYHYNNCKIISVSSVPIANHVIIIDAGHGFPDGGATSETGVIESDLNLDVALKLQDYLESSGTTVLLTRSDENGIYDADKTTIRNKKISDMQNRVKIANNSNADILVSIHMNKIPQKQYSGWQIFYKNNDDISKLIASNIQNSFNNFISSNNSREIKSISGIYLTDNVEIPLVLIECGFLSNEEETSLLQDELYQEKIAWSIYIGLMNYFN